MICVTCTLRTNNQPPPSPSISFHAVLHGHRQALFFRHSFKYPPPPLRPSPPQSRYGLVQNYDNQKVAFKQSVLRCCRCLQHDVHDTELRGGRAARPPAVEREMGNPGRALHRSVRAGTHMPRVGYLCRCTKHHRDSSLERKVKKFPRKIRRNSAVLTWQSCAAVHFFFYSVKSKIVCSHRYCCKIAEKCCTYSSGIKETNSSREVCHGERLQALD